jgi:hypothetical protein
LLSSNCRTRSCPSKSSPSTCSSSCCANCGEAYVSEEIAAQLLEEAEGAVQAHADECPRTDPYDHVTVGTIPYCWHNLQPDKAFDYDTTLQGCHYPTSLSYPSKQSRGERDVGYQRGEKRDRQPTSPARHRCRPSTYRTAGQSWHRPGNRRPLNRACQTPSRHWAGRCAPLLRCAYRPECAASRPR